MFAVEPPLGEFVKYPKYGKYFLLALAALLTSIICLWPLLCAGFALEEFANFATDPFPRFLWITILISLMMVAVGAAFIGLFWRRYPSIAAAVVAAPYWFFVFEGSKLRPRTEVWLGVGCVAFGICYIIVRFYPVGLKAKASAEVHLLAGFPLLLEALLAGLFGCFVYIVQHVLAEWDSEESLTGVLLGKYEPPLRRELFWSMTVALTALVVTSVTVARFRQLIRSENKPSLRILALLLIAGVILWFEADSRLFHIYNGLWQRLYDMNFYRMIEFGPWPR
jgi:hypothetical protein